MMSAKKSIRAGLLIAAALVLLFVAFKRPGEAQKMEEADDIIVSQEDSFCAGDLVLKLSDAGGYPIYYTLDGSIPGFESGFYEDPIVFTATDEVRSCVLRARSYDESTGEWGDLFTRTYFYADSMETLKERFSTYIVCLTSDPYNLYDYEYGIMVEGKIRDEYVNSPEYISGKLTQPANFTQQGRDWERDAFVEILSPDGERLIAQDAGMRIFGHASRQYYYKSFKLYARKAYGNDTFAYPFFADNTHGADQKVQDAYKRLVVRAHGFDKSVTLFREDLFQTLCIQIEGIYSKSVVPTSVWLNGGYYNFEWLQEVYDDTYMEENYGLMQKGDYYQKVALRANKFPDDPDEKADYGLDSSDYTVTYTAKDGTKGTIEIGDAAGDNYYAMIQDSDAVYTISSTLVSDLVFDLSSLTENDTLPSISSGNLKKVEVTQNGETTTYKKKKQRSELAGGWGTISLTQCADYNVKDLAKYGLDEANRITVTATYKDSTSGDKKTCTVYIGNENGDNRYVQLKDSDMVYEVGSSIVENMMSVDK